MDKLESFGEEAKKLLYDMRAEEAIEMLFSASEHITDGSSLNEKELVDWYACYALSIKQNRLPIEISILEREYLDDSILELEDIQGKLNHALQNLYSWFCELESIRIPSIFEGPFINPRSKSPQNRFNEIDKYLKKQITYGLSVNEWESVLTITEGQFQYVLGWCVWSDSTRSLWSTVKSGQYSKYAKLISDRENKMFLMEEIKSLIHKSLRVEEYREKIQEKFCGYNSKSGKIIEGIAHAIAKFHACQKDTGTE